MVSAAFMSDSAALFTGMACGKHKLAPKASPKKTVEGAVGGLAGGVLGMIVFRIVFFFVTVEPLPIGWCMVIGLVGAFMGQLGDLSFSIIKRQFGIKDYGRLLPTVSATLIVSTTFVCMENLRQRKRFSTISRITRKPVPRCTPWPP